MSKGKITVIIAVYNAVAYLERSVESVLNQTYQNLEIFLIDDGSNDGSSLICDQFAEKDSRVTVIHKPNEGLSVARNVALKSATGEYVSFIDSDDELRADAYMRAVQVLLDTRADFVKYDYCIDKKDFYKKIDKAVSVESAKKTVEKILKDEYGSQLWQYLFKRELWDGIISPAGRLAQDMMTLHMAASRAKQVAILHENLYYYYQTRADNVSNGNRKNVRGTADRAYAYWLRMNFCVQESAFSDMSSFCLKKAVEYTISCFGRLEFLQEKRYHEDSVFFQTCLNNYRVKINENSMIDLKRKICVEIIKRNPQLLGKLYYFLKRK